MKGLEGCTLEISTDCSAQRLDDLCELGRRPCGRDLSPGSNWGAGGHHPRQRRADARRLAFAGGLVAAGWRLADIRLPRAMSASPPRAAAGLQPELWVGCQPADLRGQCQPAPASRRQERRALAGLTASLPPKGNPWLRGDNRSLD